MDPVARLGELANALSSREIFGADEVLPFAVEAIEVMRANPERTADFEREFLRMPGYAPPEFIEICMHARWQTVKTAFISAHSAAVASNDWRREPVYRSYLEAFEDDWDDASDFYADYFQR